MKNETDILFGLKQRSFISQSKNDAELHVIQCRLIIKKLACARWWQLTTNQVITGQDPAHGIDPECEKI